MTSLDGGQTTHSSDRRGFLQLAVGVGVASLALDGLAAQTKVDGPASATAAITERPIASLRDEMQAGTLTSVALCNACIQRIAALNHRGPAIRAVLEVNPDALADAAMLDRERQQGKVRGPLHGIPVIVKDDIETAGRMQTTSGSLALLDVPVLRDAFVVARLRQAGMVILGKGNLTAWGNSQSSQAWHGYSPRGGRTRNPYALDRTTLGSGSGPAAGVAAGFAPAAIGTEVGGSIIMPAAVMGVVALKPTIGLVGRSGIVPAAITRDTAGPFGRTVHDVALLLTAMAAPDPDDAATDLGSPPHGTVDYTASLASDGLRGARIGIAWRDEIAASPHVAALFERALATFRALGAELVEAVSQPGVDVWGAHWMPLLQAELKAGMRTYLTTRRSAAPFKSLAELTEVLDRNAARETPFGHSDMFQAASMAADLESQEYRAARDGCIRVRTEAVDAVLKAHRLDALVTATSAVAWKVDPIVSVYPPVLPLSHMVPAVAGCPSLTVPMGQVSGLPAGLLLYGPAWSEARLLRYAYAYEQATRHSKRPTFPSSVDPSEEPTSTIRLP